LTKRGSKSDGSKVKLTQKEASVLHYLTNEFLTVKQVALRQGCSIYYIYRVIRKLKEKGLINAAKKKVQNFESTFEPSTPSTLPNSKYRGIRLHGQEFNINLLYADHRYKERTGQVINIDGNTVRVYKNSIEVYSGHSFYGDTVQKATVRSFQYWHRFFVRLENDLKVIIVKHRAQNIRMVNQHYAEINNELSQECEKQAAKIRVYTTEDGKLWFTIDNSFNLHEAETQHPQTAKQDMQDVVNPFFNDLRDQNPPLPSQVWKILSEVSVRENEISAGLATMVKYMQSQIPEQPELLDKPDYFG